jgi:hypothetical protein
VNVKLDGVVKTVVMSKKLTFQKGACLQMLLMLSCAVVMVRADNYLPHLDRHHVVNVFAMIDLVALIAPLPSALMIALVMENVTNF